MNYDVSELLFYKMLLTSLSIVVVFSVLVRLLYVLFLKQEVEKEVKVEFIESDSEPEIIDDMYNPFSARSAFEEHQMRRDFGIPLECELKKQK